MKKTSRYGFVPYLEMTQWCQTNGCLRVSLIDFGLRGAGRRRRLTKSGGFTNRMALRQFCGVPDVTPDFNPGNLWGPRACYTFSQDVPGGNDLQHASQISSQLTRYVTTRHCGLSADCSSCPGIHQALSSALMQDVIRCHMGPHMICQRNDSDSWWLIWENVFKWEKEGQNLSKFGVQLQPVNMLRSSISWDCWVLIHRQWLALWCFRCGICCHDIQNAPQPLLEQFALEA